jgi:hypothetical protein
MPDNAVVLVRLKVGDFGDNWKCDPRNCVQDSDGVEVDNVTFILQLCLLQIRYVPVVVDSELVLRFLDRPGQRDQDFDCVKG